MNMNCAFLRQYIVKKLQTNSRKFKFNFWYAYAYYLLQLWNLKFKSPLTVAFFATVCQHSRRLGKQIQWQWVQWCQKVISSLRSVDSHSLCVFFMLCWLLTKYILKLWLIAAKNANGSLGFEVQSPHVIERCSIKRQGCTWDDVKTSR